MVPESRSASTSASVEVGAVVDRDQARARRPAGRPGRGRAGWRAAAPAARRPRPPRAPRGPGRRRRRPVSQNASIQRAYGARRLEHRAGDQRDVRLGRRCPSGTTCAPRNVVSSVNCRATARLRASSWTVRPYPLLISTVVVPCRAHLRDQPGDVAGELLVGGGPGGGDGGADAAGGVRLPGHPGGELRRPGRRRRPGGCGCRRSRAARRARRASTRTSAAGASAARPVQATVPPSITRAASATAPRRSVARPGRW